MEYHRNNISLTITLQIFLILVHAVFSVQRRQSIVKILESSKTQRAVNIDCSPELLDTIYNLLLGNQTLTPWKKLKKSHPCSWREFSHLHQVTTWLQPVSSMSCWRKVSQVPSMRRKLVQLWAIALKRLPSLHFLLPGWLSFSSPQPTALQPKIKYSKPINTSCTELPTSCACQHVHRQACTTQLSLGN